MESRVNGFGWEHGDKCAESMEMKGSEDMSGEFCQVHAKRDMRVLKGAFERKYMMLGPGDSMEEAN